MAKQSDFNAFLTNIEPSDSTVAYISSIQRNLRSFLKSHKDYKDVHVDTFLSGSYAKHTSIRPAAGDKKRDVDIIVVTSYSSDRDSANVLEELRDVLIQKNEYLVALDVLSKLEKEKTLLINKKEEAQNALNILRENKEPLTELDEAIFFSLV
mgnify:CR=1 FL=1